MIRVRKVRLDKETPVNRLTEHSRSESRTWSFKKIACSKKVQLRPMGRPCTAHMWYAWISSNSLFPAVPGACVSAMSSIRWVILQFRNRTDVWATDFIISFMYIRVCQVNKQTTSNKLWKRAAHEEWKPLNEKSFYAAANSAKRHHGRRCTLYRIQFISCRIWLLSCENWSSRRRWWPLFKPVLGLD